MRADDLADLAFEDGHGDVADAVLALAEELLGGLADAVVGGIDLDLAGGLGHDGDPAVGQDLGRPDVERDDVHRQDVHALGERPDERAAAEAVAVTDLPVRPVGAGDRALPAARDDEGLVGPDLAVLQGHDDDDDGDDDDDDAGRDQPGCQFM